MPSLIDLTGKRYGKLTVKERGPDRYYGDNYKVTWRCVCDCGQEHVVTGNLLRSVQPPTSPDLSNRA